MSSRSAPLLWSSFLVPPWFLGASSGFPYIRWVFLFGSTMHCQIMLPHEYVHLSVFQLSVRAPFPIHLCTQCVRMVYFNVHRCTAGPNLRISHTPCISTGGPLAHYRQACLTSAVHCLPGAHRHPETRPWRSGLVIASQNMKMAKTVSRFYFVRTNLLGKHSRVRDHDLFVHYQET